MSEKELTPVYMPTASEKEAINRVTKTYTKARSVMTKNYNQFNGRTLREVVDDWEKRWNGYIPPSNPLLTDNQSNMFLNITRNIVIGYLSTVAMNPPKAKIIAVNKKTGLPYAKLADALEDLNKASLNNENGEKKFFNSALECAIKGTVIVYEGYARIEQDGEVPETYNPVTGEMKTKKEKRVLFDDCYQEIVPITDFYITNPYEPDVHKQTPIWRKITTHEDAEREFGHYANWKYVKPGAYRVEADPTTFYRNNVSMDLGTDQVEILRYYNEFDNKHIIMINGVIVYDGVIPFKDGRIPFAKTVHEPFDNFFFWGAGLPNKIMGEQDMINTFSNLMAEKTFGSLLPFVMSSDLDDFVDDPILRLNQVRKVGDINKWKVQELPGVNGGEVQMLQQVLNFMKENAGTYGGSQSYTPRGGKLQTKQIMLQQQEAMKKLGFTASLLEDLETDRTKLRISHIIQFYSIPRIEKITGKNGKEMEKLLLREVKLHGTTLSDGKKGTRSIKLVDKPSVEETEKLSEDMAVMEEKGDLIGSPVECLAVDVGTFSDYNFDIEIVKGSSYERNQTLDQAVRHEYAQYRIQMSQMAMQMGQNLPIDMKKLSDWVDESHDIDPEEFVPEQGQQMPEQPGQQPGQPQQAQGMQAMGNPMAQAMSSIKQSNNENVLS